MWIYLSGAFLLVSGYAVVSVLRWRSLTRFRCSFRTGCGPAELKLLVEATFSSSDSVELRRISCERRTENMQVMIEYVASLHAQQLVQKTLIADKRLDELKFDGRSVHSRGGLKKAA